MNMLRTYNIYVCERVYISLAYTFTPLNYHVSIQQLSMSAISH